MTQRDLNRAVARATGDDLETIARMGFFELSSVPLGSTGAPLIDWDALDADRNVEVFPLRSRPR